MGTGSAMYERFARWYDALYAAAGKDYEREASQLLELIRSRVSSPADLLDVACGTGGHLAELVDEFDEVVGVDASPAMLGVARQRLPDSVELHEADFRDFDLGRTFDVVTCLFSAIGHAGTHDGIRAAMRSMVGHVAPGGVLVVEPWVTMERWEEGYRDLDIARTDDGVVARVAYSARRGTTALLEFGWAVADEEGAHVDHERHELPLLTEDEYVEAMASTGLDVVWQDGGLIGRGLVIGRREAT